MTPSMGLINLLEQLTELKKTLFPARLSIYYKDTNQWPDEEVYRLRSETKELLSVLWEHGTCHGGMRKHSGSLKSGWQAILLGILIEFVR